jgi:phosphoribosylformylglycinamidine cyclo-ligase
MQTHGIEIGFCGGETADVGDVVRTIAVNGTMAARWPKNKLVTNEKIAAGNVIVGLSSYGQATYESDYNSGIGSNGLTSARHDVLAKHYAEYTESFDETLSSEVIYIGSHKLTDAVSIDGHTHIVGKLLLSPTRTYAPFVKKLLEENFSAINGLIHCSGGGQTKCMKYLPTGLSIVKDNLFEPPAIFKLIQASSGSDDREMYQVFNMGCRLEVYTTEENARSIIDLATSFGIDARRIGRVEASAKKELIIRRGDEEIIY